MARLLLALPLQYLHDCFRLPGVDFPGAFPGGDADLEPDLDPSRPVLYRYIVADHTDILTYSTPITSAISVAFLLAASGHFYLL
jgi:hypothetical protein